MNVKLKVLTAGALFFIGGQAVAQQKKDTTASKQIEEVVIVGFGQKKAVKELTGAVGTMKGESIKDVPVASIDKMLQGRLAGVQTGNASGQPGGFANVRIRGIASVNGGLNPIYVIDGVRVVSGDLTRSAITGNILANINSEDIESITVLKDAASTAVYGADAGAGVVVITTKSGKKGKSTINVNLEQGYNTRAIEGQKGLNIVQWRTLLANQLGNYYNITPDAATLNAVAGSYNSLTSAIQTAFTSVNNSDWRAAVQNDKAYQQTANISISGGSDKVKYYNSANYFFQESIVKASDFKRLAATSKIDYEVSDKLKITTDLQMSYSKINTLNNGGAFANPLLAELFLRPSDPIYNADGSYYLGVNGRLSNSLFNNAYLATKNYYRAQTARVFGNFSAEYKLLKNLNYKLVFGPEFINIENDTYLNPNHGDGYAVNGRKTESAERYFNFNLQNILSYNFNLFSKNHFNVSVIQEAYKRQTRLVGAQATIVGTPSLETLSNFIKPAYTQGERSQFSRMGYAAILNYDYNKFIMVDASVRRDALSNFTEGQKFGNFWSAGIGVDLAKLDFIKNLDKISQMKFRSSYGKVGNQISSSPYSLYSYTTNYNDNPAGNYGGVFNPNLKWETIKPLSIGLDLGLLNNKLTITVDYFKKTTSDLVFNVPVSLAQGLSTYDINVGELENKGYEFSVNANLIDTKDLFWSVGGNISTLENKVTKLYGGQDIISGVTILREGEGVGTFYMRKWAGVDAATGAPLWYVNGVDGATTSTYANAGLAVQGNSFSKLYGGLNTRLSYKGFNLDVQGTFGFGGKVYNDWASYTLSDGQYTINYPGAVDQMDFWTPSNPNAANPKPIYGNTTLSNRASSRFLSKTDYWRLSNVRLGYVFNMKALKNAGISSLEVYALGNNLLTYTYDKTLRFDPENNLNTANNLNLPVLKTVSFGLNLKF